MPLTEINFDSIIGPSHNYAGLSLGNLASAKNAGGTAYPRAAALQGVEKMRANIQLGLTQGIFLPHRRPNRSWLAQLGMSLEDAPDGMIASAMSASSMWAANAGTVSPAPDTQDGKCHITVANLLTMPHRSHEWPETLRQLQLAFADPAFVIHTPIIPPFGDEGAANHMRLCAAHGEKGVEVFVYSAGNGPFPARQHRVASEAVARLNKVDDPVFVRQSDEAIAAGAFHNDVVAVANERVLFIHELAFAEKNEAYATLRQRLPELEIIEVAAHAITLADAIRSYLFNAQLVTLPKGGMALIVPEECKKSPKVWIWLQTLLATNGPIRQIIPVDVRQSMANGGGPACLRLRIVADPAHVDPRFLVDEVRLDHISEIIKGHWPESVTPSDIKGPKLWSQLETARNTLLTELGFVEFLSI